MSREWKPGDVARVQCSDGEWRRAMCGESKMGIGVAPSWMFPDRSLRYVDDSIARPLVVLDPEDREAVERLWIALRDGLALRSRDNLISALREYASPPPPKPDEPQGLGAVVEDEDGVQWTRVERGEAQTRNPWYPADCDKQPREWAEIAAVEVLNGGVIA